MRQSKAVKKFKRKMIRSIARKIYFTNWGCFHFLFSIIFLMYMMAVMDSANDWWVLGAVGCGVASVCFALLGYRSNNNYNVRVAEYRRLTYDRIQARRMRNLDNLELYRNLKDMEKELQFLH